MRPSIVPDRQPRAVLYLRQSISREESISLSIQEEAGRQYCERMGYTVVAVEEDPGVSGRTWNRPGVRRVMEMVEQRRADVIVLWKWSRLSRARLDWAVAVDKVESAGGRIESATEPVDTTTSTGRLARGMLAEFAAFESERIGDVWKETLSRRVRQGLPATGGKRFGYTKVDKDTYLPDSETAPILAEAYRRYVDEEHGFGRLVAWLNGAGYRTVTGALWAPDKIRAVLDAGFAAGLIVTGYRTGELQYFPGRHEQVITTEMWDRFRAKRDGNSYAPAAAAAKTMLSGLLRCDDCGSPMRSAQRSPTVRGYGCGGYLRFHDGRRYVTCTQHAVEDHVRAWVSELAEDVEALAIARAGLAERRVAAINDANAIQSRLEKLRATLGQVAVRYASGQFSQDAYDAASTQLEREISDLDKRRRVVAPGNPVEVDVRSLAVHVADVWDLATAHEMRTLLSKMIAYVKVIPPEERKPGGAGAVTFEVVPAWER